jgi:hypothetical protein
MTERHYAYVVTLDHDIREDDSQHLIDAISCLRSVVSVKPLVTDHVVHSAEDRVKHRYMLAMWEAVRAVFEGKLTADAAQRR